MSKGQKNQKNRVVCEAFIEPGHGHLVLFILVDGEPVLYRQFWCSPKYRNSQGRFDARGFRRKADTIIEMVTHPDEELVVSRRNCDRETYTKLTVGCSKKTAKLIENAMKKDRDQLLEKYGISAEEAKAMSQRAVRRHSFREWLFATETDAERSKRIAEKKAARKAKKEEKAAARNAAKQGKDGESK